MTEEERQIQQFIAEGKVKVCPTVHLVRTPNTKPSGINKLKLKEFYPIDDGGLSYA
jgi:hypothetical protein